MWQGGQAIDGALALSIALWLIAVAPQWILLVWGTRSIGSIRELVARRPIAKLLVVVTWVAAFTLAMVGTVVVCRDLLGPKRLGIQRAMANATLVEQVVLIGIGLLLLRRRGSDDVRRPGQTKTLSLGGLWRLLAMWMAAGLVVVALAIGPFTEGDRTWRVTVVVIVASFGVAAGVYARFRRRRRHPAEDR
jgi:hypothetical protein